MDVRNDQSFIFQGRRIIFRWRKAIERIVIKTQHDMSVFVCVQSFKRCRVQMMILPCWPRVEQMSRTTILSQQRTDHTPIHTRDNTQIHNLQITDGPYQRAPAGFATCKYWGGNPALDRVGYNIGQDGQQMADVYVCVGVNVKHAEALTLGLWYSVFDVPQIDL